ncbi:hypothetical protein PVAP13_8KG310300 [Panicum virgatum]|uniref:Uncharacterized protein n=1 Tax=Panicum virgatum TaxID=38727 RepID=A0A8T0PW71_PANVG|nr:hypothetical protein PVAP13_8KG310300 [Panicum virgatum]
MEIVINKDTKALCLATFLVMAMLFTSGHAQGGCSPLAPCDEILCAVSCDRRGFKNPKPTCVFPRIGHSGDKCCCQ